MIVMRKKRKKLRSSRIPIKKRRLMLKRTRMILLLHQVEELPDRLHSAQLTDQREKDLSKVIILLESIHLNLFLEHTIYQKMVKMPSDQLRSTSDKL